MKSWLWHFCFFCLIAGVTVADTIKLKDGTVLEGEILSETPTNISIEVASAGGRIMNTTVVPVANIAEVARLSPEQKRDMLMQHEFTRLQTYTLNSNVSYAVEYYDKVMNGIFRKFVRTYPGSPHEAEVTDRIKQWQAERDRVAAGQFMSGGEWMGKAEFDKYHRWDQIRAFVRDGDRLAAQSNWPAAVQKYEAVLALSPGGGTETATKRQMVAALTKWLAWLQRDWQTGTAALANARDIFQQAQAKLDAARAQDTKSGGTGSTQYNVIRAQTAMNNAQAKWTVAQAERDRLKRTMDQIKQRLDRDDLKDFSPKTNTEVEVAASTTPTGSPDVTTMIQNWFSEYWTVALGIAVVVLIVFWRAMR